MDDEIMMPPGSFGMHEAMHTAHVLHDTVERHLVEHTAIQQDPELKAIAERAAQALYDLYQAIGAKHMDALPKEE